MRPLSSSDIVSRNRCPAPTSTAAPCTPSVCSDSTTHGPCARSCPIITSHWAAGTASRKVGESRVLRSLSTGSEFIWPTIQASCFSIGLVPNVAVTVGVTAGALAVPDAVPVAVPDEEGVVALVALAALFVGSAIAELFGLRPPTTDLEMTYQKIYQTLEQEGTDR